MALKHGLFLLALACFVAYGTATRDLLMKWPKQGGDHVECWSNLIELKSCSNEILHFFINGQADIGPNCCCAITVITHNCWPTMLTSLGFTYQEALYISGYCDAAASSPALAPAGAGDGPASPILKD
ncbi:Egg cell-secreted protein 1.3 [Spatholobus suberectus]|nr:Egg cell-secreted protein 1.3 [Spatholobus suberectus]